MKTTRKHLRKPTSYDRYDRIYDDWPHLPMVRTLTVTPLKSIYINRSASLTAVDVLIRSVERLEEYIIENGLDDLY